MKLLSLFALLILPLPAEPTTGLAPEVTDLDASDVSYNAEKNLPDLKTPFINAAPRDRKDGISVGTPTTAQKEALLTYANEISKGDHGDIDSLLVCHQGKLIFESYYRRGRVNFPHYQMSITKSYTAFALGRAIQLGHLTSDDLNKSALSFLKNVDRSKLVPGAEKITLHEAMNMRSGIRIEKDKARKLMRQPNLLAGQGQIQVYLQHSSPIPPAPRDFKYQGSDPSLTMQVLEAVVPGSAKDFIQHEVLAKMGITNFGWKSDISGLPKSAAGSSMRSRDMLKWGLLALNKGCWNKQQLIPASFVDKALSPIHTNPAKTSYGYFWWQHQITTNNQSFTCHSGRGAGGQFILIVPKLNLVTIVTAHHKGMGTTLKTFPEKILPPFLPRP